MSGKHRRCLPKSGQNKSLCFFLFFVVVVVSLFFSFIELKIASPWRQNCVCSLNYFQHMHNSSAVSKRTFVHFRDDMVPWSPASARLFGLSFFPQKLTHLPPSKGSFPVAFSQMPGLITHSRRGFWLNISRQGPLNGDWRQLAPHRPKEVSSST